MKFKVLGCYGGNVQTIGMTAFLVNDVLGLDGGWVTGALSLPEQEKVRDILISHAHLDHTCSLPFIVDNNFAVPGFCLRIHALPEVVDALQNHLFNNSTWPDFTCLPNDKNPVLRLLEVHDEQPFYVAGLTARAIRVSHLVPTAGFIVDDGQSALAFSADTGPTHRFWEIVNDTPNLKAIITECSFPNELQRIADISGHLSPQTLGEEVKKIKRDVPIYLYGFKPRFIPVLTEQVQGLSDPRLVLLEQGRTYEL